MNPTEEGRRAFMDKLPENACPYDNENTKAAIEWKLGYYKQEYCELEKEQSSLLDSMNYFSEPWTGLEKTLRDLEQTIRDYNDQLRSGNLS